MTRLPHVREVTWYLPMRLYYDLAQLRDSVKTGAGARWVTVEALAVHLLVLGVRGMRDEITRQAEATRLVQPVAVMPKKLKRH